MDTEICEQVDIYEQVREAVRQAVSDTLARIATRVSHAVVTMHMPDCRSASTDIPMHRMPRMAGTASLRR